MDQREKLIELLLNNPKAKGECYITMCNTDCKYYKSDNCYTEMLADYLLANGVVVLPRKVGDTVYQIGRDFCDKRNHDKCDVYCDGWDDLCPENNGEWEIQTRVFTTGLFDLVGKSIYLTREEAEKALAKRKGGE